MCRDLIPQVGGLVRIWEVTFEISPLRYVFELRINYALISELIAGFTKIKDIGRWIYDLA